MARCIWASLPDPVRALVAEASCCLQRGSAPRLLSGGWWHRRPPLSKHQNSRLPEECRCSAYTTSFAQLGHSGPPLSFQVAGAFRSPSSPTPAKGQPRKETGRVNSHPNIKCVPSFATCHTFLGPPGILVSPRFVEGLGPL